MSSATALLPKLPSTVHAAASVELTVLASQAAIDTAPCNAAAGC